LKQTVSEIFGVSAALLTPFDHSGGIAHELMAKHASHVLANGCSSITLFGTTGEGASVGTGERMEALARLLEAGINPDQVVMGIKADAISDAIEELRAGIGQQCSSFLLAPPHFFKGVSDEGLYCWYCAVLSEFSGQELRIILYNIPQLTGVTISTQLAARLQVRFPSLVYGVKDSSGEWSSAQGFLTLKDDLAILIGDERLLVRSAGLGAQGCISGLANFYGKELSEMMQTGIMNPSIFKLVEILVTVPIVPAVKLFASHIYNVQQWLNVRPPLTGLNNMEKVQLLSDYENIFKIRVGA